MYYYDLFISSSLQGFASTFATKYMIFHHSNTWKPSFIAHFTIFVLCFHHVSPCSPFFNHISLLSPLIQPLIPVDPKTVWHPLRLRGLLAVRSQRRRGSGLLRHGGKHLGPEVVRAGKVIDPNWWCSTAMFNYQKGNLPFYIRELYLGMEIWNTMIVD